MNDRTIILLFAKAPAPGAVKTRLAAALGVQAAADLSRCFLLDMVDALSRSAPFFRVCYAPADGRDLMRSLLPAGIDLQPQEGADLGERMERAFRTAFTGGFERVVLVGSDIPDLPPVFVDEAFHALAENDLVLGPARDGGYYLIGLTARGLVPELFRGIAWSRADVLERTVIAGHHAGLKLHLVPAWSDIDSLEDLDAFRRRDAASRSCPRTMACLGKGLYA